MVLRTFYIRAILSLAGLALISASHAQSSSPTEASVLLAAKEAATAYDLQGLLALEPAAVRAAGNTVVKTREILTLHLANGDSKTYRNTAQCSLPEQEAKCIRFVLVAHAATYHLYIVAKTYYEDVDYLVIDDQNGAETSLRAFPLISPTGQHILALIATDDNLGSVVQIWRREKDRFAIEWKSSPYTDGMYTEYKLLGWHVEGRIDLLAVTAFEPPKADRRTAFAVSLGKHGWEVLPVQ